MTAYPLCACGCGRQADPRVSQYDGGAYWRLVCLTRLGRLVRDMQSMTPAALGMVVSVLRDNGRGELADVVVGALPFTPSDATLERLTDE